MQQYNLLGALLAAADKNPTKAPAIMISPGGEIISATYTELATPPMAVIRAVGTVSALGVSELLTDTQSTGAGTTATNTINYTTVNSSTNRAGGNLKPVFAVSARIGLQNSPAGQGQVVVTWANEDGESLNNTVQFLYPAGGYQGFDLFMYFIPGINIKGPFYYNPATLAVALSDVTPTAIFVARNLTLAWTGLPIQTTVTTRVINMAHEDAVAIIAAASELDSVARLTALQMGQQALADSAPQSGGVMGRVRSLLGRKG